MGLGIGLAAMSRAEAVTLFPLLAIPFAFLVTRRGGGKINWKHGIRYSLAAGIAGGLLMAPWLLYNLTRFEHPVLVSNGVGSVLMVANCDSTVPAGDAQAGTYRGTYHGLYVGYWSIFCAGDLGAKLDKFYSPKRAAYLKAQLGIIPGTDKAFFGDESTHEVAWRAVGTAEIKDHLSQMPWTALLRVGRMWDFFRPEQNILFNGVFEGRGGGSRASRRSSTTPCWPVPSSGWCSCGAAACRSCRSSRSPRPSRSPPPRPSASPATGRRSTRCCRSSPRARSCGCSKTPARRFRPW